MSTNTPENYEDFFLQKFVTLFRKFINTTLENISDQTISENFQNVRDDVREGLEMSIQQLQNAQLPAKVSRPVRRP